MNEVFVVCSIDEDRCVETYVFSDENEALKKALTMVSEEVVRHGEGYAITECSMFSGNDRMFYFSDANGNEIFVDGKEVA